MSDVKRLQRIAWSSLTAISLLLGAATLWLWVRSYGRIDRFDYVQAPARYTVNCARGHFEIEIDRNAGYAIPEQGLIWTPWSGPQGAADEAMVIRTMDYQFPRRIRFFGFTWGPPRGSQYVVTGAFWPLLFVAGMLPVWRFVSYGRRVIRRQRKGVCFECGYDLRATPDRCPECGAVTARS